MGDDSGIVEPHVERTLRYVAALEAGGGTATTHHLDAFATTNVPAGRALGTALQAAASSGPRTYLIQSGQPLSGYLISMGWIEARHEEVFLTERGRALLRGIHDPTLNIEQSLPILVVFEPDSPWKDHELAKAMRGAGPEAMLVDPFLDEEILRALAVKTSVRKFLMSDRPRRLENISTLLAAFASEGVHLQVRTVQERLIHDRAIVGDDGGVTLLGASLNSRKLSTMIPLPPPVAAPYRMILKELWGKANPVTSDELIP